MESEYRHRIKSNQKVKYLYSEKLGVIHDKHCQCVKDIPDEDLRWSEEYYSELKLCPECMIRVCITIGAKDPEEFRIYLQFFEKISIAEEQIRYIFIECKMKTRIVPNGMIIWYKDDTWRIKALAKKGRVQLYHNNYMVKENGEREIVSGFHIQGNAGKNMDINRALKIISTYQYRSEEYMLHRRSSI